MLFPLSVTEMLGKVDVSARVSGGGPTGQAGAIRFAVSKALTAHLKEEGIIRLMLGTRTLNCFLCQYSNTVYS